MITARSGFRASCAYETPPKTPWRSCPRLSRRRLGARRARLLSGSGRGRRRRNLNRPAGRRRFGRLPAKRPRAKSPGTLRRSPRTALRRKETETQGCGRSRTAAAAASRSTSPWAARTLRVRRPRTTARGGWRRLEAGSVLRRFHKTASRRGLSRSSCQTPTYRRASRRKNQRTPRRCSEPLNLPPKSKKSRPRLCARARRGTASPNCSSKPRCASLASFRRSATGWRSGQNWPRKRVWSSLG
mmetsp:Transcript_18060/g.60905  ORF Transcript_18060/g.60905 Transcript_18060/m.60905 type:complete len:243 (-) Transcript_18060:4126-4854(-)